jgi:hypothetical protein
MAMAGYVTCLEEMAMLLPLQVVEVMQLQVYMHRDYGGGGLLSSMIL